MSAGPASDELETRLREVDALRRRVLNVIPHALRTPITTFRGLAEALSNATDDEIRGSITPALQRLAAQAEHLLDDMLLAAGLTTTLPTGEPVATPVAATATAVWAEVAAGHPPLKIDGDAAVLAPPGSFRKMLVHVLDNAAKYGNAPPTMQVRVSGTTVEVSLDSPGDEVKELEMLGEPFFRTERAVMHSAGLGVGLTVARALAEHAGGGFRVEAREGGGLVTTIVLQAAKT